LKEVCNKVPLSENLHQQSCKAFAGLSNRVKMIGEGRLLINVNFALSEPLLGAAVMLSALSQNLTNTLFASQLLQWNNVTAISS